MQDLRNDLKQNVFQRARPEGDHRALLGQEMAELGFPFGAGGDQQGGGGGEGDDAAEYAPPPLLPSAAAEGDELAEV